MSSRVVGAVTPSGFDAAISVLEFLVAVRVGARHDHMLEIGRAL